MWVVGCGMWFADRLRTVAHLSDPRVRSKIVKDTCRDAVLRGDVPPVDPAVLLVARERDRLQRTDARRLGHTRPVVPFSQHANFPAVGKAVLVPRKRLREKTPLAQAGLVWHKRRCLG